MAIGYSWFDQNFRRWVDEFDIGRPVPHQARHTLATNLLRNGASLTHIKRYLGQFPSAWPSTTCTSPTPTP